MPRLTRRSDGSIRRECIECGIEKSLENSFYKSNISIYDSRMLICKDCVREIKDIEKIKDILRMNDIVFLEDLWLRSNQNTPEYLKNLSLSQYKNLRWGDSYTPKNQFQDNVINTLKGEIEALTPKLKQTREDRDYGTYKNLINAYREVLNLLNDHYKIHGINTTNEKVNMYINYIVLPNKNKVEVLIRDKHYMIWGNAFKKIEDFINPIKQIAENENAIVYIDVNGYGIALYDLLSGINGLTVKRLRLDNSYISGIF